MQKLKFSHMPFEFVQIPANGQGTAKEELNKLLRGRKVVSVRKEFVANGEDSFWAFCLEYLEITAERDRLSPEKVDYKAVLSEADFAVFSKLRVLRKELAEKEAVPAYAIFTNEQLAEMVKRKVGSVAKLGEIGGVGAARVEKYGAEFLALLQPQPVEEVPV
jgi:superfamily II DNA helicase RecQ